MTRTTIALVSALALCGGGPAFAGDGSSPKAGGPQGGVQSTTGAVAPTTTGGTAVGGNVRTGSGTAGSATPGGAQSNQATETSEPSSKGGK